MLLEMYIKGFLLEVMNSSDASEISVICEKLNKASIDLRKHLESDDYSGSIKDLPHYIFDVMENVAYSNKPRIELLEEGSFRSGFSMSGKPWVLKIALQSMGADINKQEIDICLNKAHGASAADIFIKVFDYDKVNEKPYWYICEKVKPLSDIEDLGTLKNVFPTFWNILDHGENNRVKRSAASFKEFLSKTISSCVYEAARLPKMKKKTSLKSDEEKYREMLMFNRNLLDRQGKDDAIDKLNKVTSNFNKSGKLDELLPKINKNIFYNAARHHGNIKDSKDIIFYEDFKRLSAAFGYINTTDMHDDNFGVKIVENPGPGDIVILDFDIDI